MTKRLIGFVIVFLLLMGISLIVIDRKNKASTEIAKEASITVTSKIETKYSNFTAFVDSAEQAKREAEYTNRLILRSNMYKDQANEKLLAEKEALEKDKKWLQNEIKTLRDSLRSYHRVRYGTN